MIVVPVFMISCHVSENRNIGPEKAQTRTTRQQRMKVIGLPVARETEFAMRVKTCSTGCDATIVTTVLQVQQALRRRTAPWDRPDAPCRGLRYRGGRQFADDPVAVVQ